MRVCELINNSQFTFNLDFRIVLYDFDKDKTTVLYDSAKEKGDIPFDLMLLSISAINMSDDGIVEIEVI